MVEEEIRQMEEDMQSQMSETPSVKSRAQEIMDEVMAEEEEKMSMSQSHKQSAQSRQAPSEIDNEGSDSN